LAFFWWGGEPLLSEARAIPGVHAVVFHAVHYWCVCCVVRLARGVCRFPLGPGVGLRIVRGHSADIVRFGRCRTAGALGIIG